MLVVALIHCHCHCVRIAKIKRKRDREESTRASLASLHAGAGHCVEKFDVLLKTELMRFIIAFRSWNCYYDC